jgi:hypothetical protein
MLLLLGLGPGTFWFSLMDYNNLFIEIVLIIQIHFCSMIYVSNYELGNKVLGLFLLALTLECLNYHSSLHMFVKLDVTCRRVYLM